jgi:predicted TIM-barrel fold metal-dependent hydrolase
MTRSSRRFGLRAAILVPGIVIAPTIRILRSRQLHPIANKQPAVTEPVPALTPFVDVHTHFDENDSGGTIRSVLSTLDRENAARIFLQMPPDTFDHPGHYDAEVILPAAKRYPDKLGVLGGGGTLNAMIQQSVVSGESGPEIQKKFRDRAEELIREGVIGFGEMTAEHFDGLTPYQYAPANHPLFLALADIAAKYDVPIDLHMEAVPKSMLLPSDLKSPPNAPQLHGNIQALERLLFHNTHAKILWAHAGTDLTGFRTPDLCRQLLRAHPNLYMEIKTDTQNVGKNYPLADDGKIKPDWLQLFEDFPDRFIIGSDQHYPEGKGSEQRWQTVVLLFNQLPSDVRRKIGTENVLRIFPGKPAASSANPGKKN